MHTLKQLKIKALEKKSLENLLIKTAGGLTGSLVATILIAHIK